MNDLIGFLLVVAGGFMGGTYFLGLKQAKPWSWENIWLTYSVFALFVLPVALVAINVPRPADALALVPSGALAEVFLLGIGWGIGAALSGLGVDRVGVGLGVPLLVGTAAASGALVPMVVHTPELVFRPKGLVVIASVFVLSIGVALVAIAGKKRDVSRAAHHESGQKGSFLAGLVICIFGGILSSMLNLAFSFSKPLAEAAVSTGASRGGAENFVWMVALAGGFIVNLVYTLLLLGRNHTWKNFTIPGSGRPLVVGILMALFWYGGSLAYGHGATVLGTLGTIVGWPVFVSSMMIFSTIWGFVTGEWKNSSRQAKRYMLAGLIVLVVASGFSVISKTM